MLKTLSPEALPPLVRLLDYERPDGDARKQQIVREGIAAILGTHLAELDACAARPWTRWQGCAVWAHGKLDEVRERIQELAPPAQRDTARRMLLHHMDA